MAEIKEKTKNVDKIKHTYNEILHFIKTVILEGCGRNIDMNIECQLLRLKLTTPQPASTEL